MSGDGGVGLERLGGTGEVAGLDEAELGLEGRREGLDDLLPELSREFLLKRPVLRGEEGSENMEEVEALVRMVLYVFQKIALC